jgi:hypothetical protein
MDDPTHGKVMMNGSKISVQQTQSLASQHPAVELDESLLSRGLVCYAHDNSDTLNDTLIIGKNAFYHRGQHISLRSGYVLNS